jgi:hypothetical protein
MTVFAYAIESLRKNESHGGNISVFHKKLLVELEEHLNQAANGVSLKIGTSEKKIVPYDCGED